MTDVSSEALQQALDQIRADHQAILHRIRQEQRNAKAIARHAWHIQEEERGRFARELHDGLGQSLTALKNELTRLADAEESVDWRERVRAAVDLCAECLEDTRFISRMLRPALLDDLGLESALRQLCRTIEREGLETELIGLDQTLDLGEELGTLVFRLIQEAATNTVKHAEATTFIVRFIAEPDRLILLIMDDGRGFETASSDLVEKGFGLQAMSERVRLFGGRIDIESSPGEGTRVRASIPTASDREDQQ
ncbi:MAG: sensor histidine kinase [Xanthomonadales bacterium]|nr:sensor histidine kinase [Xanthomonadales bacterium]